MVAFRVDPTLKAQLGGLARTHERTLSGEVRLALRRHVERETTIRDGASRAVREAAAA
ncbi:MAG TPA: hypothetical protein VFW41_11845 [Gaiellaceae bacterium]|nr:hypothetical protein [Gaiellaceae bacterium]